MELTDKLNNLPHQPGVYLLLGARGNVIYVGKARDLRARVPAHLSAQADASPRSKALRRAARDVEYMVTGSDVEALILEANLIKLHQPRYNVRLKDDKKYPYIKVTVQEEWPRAFPTRDLRKDGSVLFGPYSSAKSMRRALHTARKIFPLRSCKSRRLPRRLCLDYHINRCYGPCQGLVSPEDYRRMVDGLLQFLAGKSDLVEKALQAQMDELAREERYEQAARVRDQLESVRAVVRKQRMVFADEKDRDVLALERQGRTACVTMLLVRDGKLVGCEHYFLTVGAGMSNGEALGAFMAQYYRNAFFIPQEIYVEAMPEDSETMVLWLMQRRDGRVKLMAPHRGDGFELVKLAHDNARLALEDHLLSREGKRIPESLHELQQVLHLKVLPRTIEAYDISTIGGSHACGSMVVFRDGRADKSHYRRYRIRDVDGIDDYAMMREVVLRRMRRVKEEGRPPDLLLVDGGRGQVNSALAAMREVGVDVPVVGLAKRLDELHVMDGGTLMLPKGSPALRLVQRIRDEAHRFAHTYHQQMRTKGLTRSCLEEVPGVGKVLSARLLTHFPSVEALTRASPDEIAVVPGVGRERAERIHRYLVSSGYSCDFES